MISHNDLVSAYNKKRNSMIIGKKFHQLTVLCSVANRVKRKNGHRLWFCICDCGKSTIVRSNSLGKTKSCGCRIIHKSLQSNTSVDSFLCFMCGTLKPLNEKVNGAKNICFLCNNALNKHEVTTLTDSYISHKLKRSFGFSEPSMILLKREQLLMLRKIRNLKEAINGTI